MNNAYSYSDLQENTATTAKAKRAQGHAKRMLDMIAEFRLLAKNNLLPGFVGLFAFVDELLKIAKNDAVVTLSQASAVETAALKTAPQPVMAAPKSPSITKSEPKRIMFRNENPLQVKSIKESMPVLPTNLTSRPSKPEVKAERQILKEVQLDGKIVFRKGDVALKPTANLARPKELDMAEKAVRDENGTILFLSAEENKKRGNGNKIKFWTPDVPTANVNNSPYWVTKRRSKGI